VTERNNIKGER